MEQKLRTKYKIVEFLFYFSFALLLGLTIKNYIYPFSGKSDFYIYQHVTKDALHNVPIYQRLYINTPFTYPMSVFFMTLPFSFFPFVVGSTLWTLCSIIAFLGSIFLFFSLFLPKLSLAQKLFISALFLQVPAIQDTLFYGQLNITVLFFVMLSFYFFYSKLYYADILTGVSLGIAGGLKLLPFFLLLFFISKRKYAIVLITCTTFFLMIGIVRLFGIQLHYLFDYIAFIPHFAAPQEHSWASLTMKEQIDQSLTALLNTFGVARNVRTELVILISGLVTLVGICHWKFAKKTFGLEKERDFYFYAFLFLVVTVFPVTLVWQHHLVFLLPMEWILLYRFLVKPHIQTCCVFIITFLLFNLNPFDIRALLISLNMNSDTVLVMFHVLIGTGFLLIIFLADLLQTVSQTRRDIVLFVLRKYHKLRLQ